MPHKNWLAVMGVLATTPLAAQQPAATPLAAGVVAPAFELDAGNKSGLAGRLSLADLHDKTVVIAFFYRARSRG